MPDDIDDFSLKFVRHFLAEARREREQPRTVLYALVAYFLGNGLLIARLMDSALPLYIAVIFTLLFLAGCWLEERSCNRRIARLELREITLLAEEREAARQAAEEAQKTASMSVAEWIGYQREKRARAKS